MFNHKIKIISLFINTQNLSSVKHKRYFRNYLLLLFIQWKSMWANIVTDVLQNIFSVSQNKEGLTGPNDMMVNK